MLRKNPSFLSYIERLYDAMPRKEDIVMKTFRKGELLFAQGQDPVKVFIVKEGVTKCYFSEDNGKEYILEFLSEGEILGELEALRTIPCLCNVAAVSDVQAYALNLPFFKGLLEKDLHLNHMLLNALAERIINTSSRSSSQQLYTIGHGLSKILELQERQEISISKEDMAAYLGVTLRSLNRALKDLD